MRIFRMTLSFGDERDGPESTAATHILERRSPVKSPGITPGISCKATCNEDGPRSAPHRGPTSARLVSCIPSLCGWW